MISEPSQIVIRCPNWVGDVVMATPAIRAVRREFPRAHLAVMIKSYARQLLEDSPYIDEYIELPAGERNGIARYYPFLLSLRKQRFDLGLLLPNSFRSAWELFLAGVRNRAGYIRQGRGPLLTKAIPPPREGGKLRIINMVDSYLALCEAIGCRELDRKEELFASPECEELADRIFAENGVERGQPVIALAPGAGYGPSKLYPIDRYAGVMDRLVAKYSARLLLVTSPREEDLRQKVLSHLKTRPLEWREPRSSLALLKSLLNRCCLLVTNDTGPRHIAVAFEKPVVCVMGPTSSLYTDVNLEKTILVRERVECSPCQLKVCPIDHRCMTRLAADRVYQAAVTLMEQERCKVRVEPGP